MRSQAEEVDTKEWTVEPTDPRIKWTTYGNHVFSDGDYPYFYQGYGNNLACGQDNSRKIKNKPGMGFQAQGPCEGKGYQYYQIWG